MSIIIFTCQKYVYLLVFTCQGLWFLSLLVKEIVVVESLKNEAKKK